VIPDGDAPQRQPLRYLLDNTRSKPAVAVNTVAATIVPNPLLTGWSVSPARTTRARPAPETTEERQDREYREIIVTTIPTAGA
jgi:hypothetical protein